MFLCTHCRKAYSVQTPTIWPPWSQFPTFSTMHFTRIVVRVQCEWHRVCKERLYLPMRVSPFSRNCNKPPSIFVGVCAMHLLKYDLVIPHSGNFQTETQRSIQPRHTWWNWIVNWWKIAYTAGRHMIIFRRKQNAFEWSSDNPDEWRLSTYEAGNLWKNTFFWNWSLGRYVPVYSLSKSLSVQSPPYDHHGVNFQHSPQCISQELWCGCNASDIVSARALHICQCGCRLFHATAIRHDPFLWVYLQCIC